jgi:hypothetical protein
VEKWEVAKYLFPSVRSTEYRLMSARISFGESTENNSDLRIGQNTGPETGEFSPTVGFA